ncbi:AAA family ATPase [Cronobacter malonaticus]|uniref:AAA family ATPase n=1 Tax=Cronobacter malonaticus TaxID=413503 RepID=UPI002DB6CBBC|nr:AAA family ATPase [Cronobacter malonaticus]MEB8480269.1 AAA family ATPase [Cronobacter malonaticus]
MLNWKIARIKINNFKAFQNIELNFENASLLTLEGPNGYGKTSIFDSLELLFTGKIERLQRLCQDIMPGQQKNFQDNLYWNNRVTIGDLEIRVQLENKDTNRKIFLCRRADSNDLSIIQNNRADNFDIFKLYKLQEFDSVNYDEELQNIDIEDYLGSGFVDRFNKLNYLEQGQSSFVFSKKITDRKTHIDKLMSTDGLVKKIDFCRNVESKITRLLNDKITSDRILELKQKINEKKKTFTDHSSKSHHYQKISTHSNLPEWDNVTPNCFDSPKITHEHEVSLNTLLILRTNLNETKIKLYNKEIDSFVSKFKPILADIVQFGSFISFYDTLIIKRNKNLEAAKCISVLKKSLKLLTTEDLESIRGRVTFQFDDFLNRLSSYQNKNKELENKNARLSEVNDTRNKLFQLQLNGEDKDRNICLFCGHDWLTTELLISALDCKKKELVSAHADLINKITEEEKYLNEKIEKSIKDQKNLLEESRYDIDLLNALDNNKNKFEIIKKVMGRLIENDIAIPNEFTTDATILSERCQNLLLSINKLKNEESLIFPNNWHEILNTTFAQVADIENLSIESIHDKINYFLMKKNESTNEALKKLSDELYKIEQRKSAMMKLREKIRNLKLALDNINKNYSQKTISDIELTFHIYSGRLIQNYQRGLGLFIDEGNGDRVRFCTAEKSEHDATLSMSSGQLSALSLAFFLSLNKVYAKTPLVLIDDPAQSLDEINIASLSDLLRCELKDRQLILSSHEDNISSYLRYRFMRAGLKQKSFHMQSISSYVNNDK